MWNAIKQFARECRPRIWYARHQRYERLLHRFEKDKVTEKEIEHPTVYFAFDSYDEPSGK